MGYTVTRCPAGLYKGFLPGRKGSEELRYSLKRSRQFGGSKAYPSICTLATHDGKLKAGSSDAELAMIDID